MLKFEEKSADIIDMYENKKYTLRHISDIYGTNHHQIRKILIKFGIKISQRPTQKPYTEEKREKNRLSHLGQKSWCKGLKQPEETNRKNMIGHMLYDILLEDLSHFKDFNKLKFLTQIASRNIKFLKNKEIYLHFLNKFYFDKYFNLLYNNWLLNNKNKWLRPTLEHIQPKSKNGTYELDNLEFLTWFENRAKADMTKYEWEEFKKKTNTFSDLFK